MGLKRDSKPRAVRKLVHRVWAGNGTADASFQYLGVEWTVHSLKGSTVIAVTRAGTRVSPFQVMCGGTGTGFFDSRSGPPRADAVMEACRNLCCGEVIGS